MGVDLELIVPENRTNEKKVIEDYYSFVFSIEKKLSPEIVFEKSTAEIRQENTLSWFEKKGFIFISERVYSDISSVLDWQRVYELFGGIYESDKTIIYGDNQGTYPTIKKSRR